MTPAAVHYGHAKQLRRHQPPSCSMPPTSSTPERFVRKPPVPPEAADRRLDQQAGRYEGGRCSLNSTPKRLTGLDRLRRQPRPGDLDRGCAQQHDHVHARWRRQRLTQARSGDRRDVHGHAGRLHDLHLRRRQRAKTVSYSDSSSENITSITYDSDGQRTAMTDGTGTLVLELRLAAPADRATRTATAPPSPTATRTGRPDVRPQEPGPQHRLSRTAWERSRRSGTTTGRWRR